MTLRRPLHGAGVAALVGLVALAGLLGLRWADPATPSAPAAPTAALGRAEGFSLMAAGGGARPVTASPTAAVRSPEDVAHALYVDGSLRGSSPDGDWGVDAQGHLQPGLALRRRFDHYLSAIGEASVTELRGLVQTQATQDVGAAAAAHILAVWDRYLALQQHRWTTAADPSDPQSASQALSERQRVRREYLGPAWAEAFYAAEEAQLRADLAALGSPRAPTGTSTSTRTDALHAPADPTDAQARARLHQQRVMQYGEEAARRLAELDATEAEWQRRLGQARREIARIEQSPELSGPQRLDAVERYLAEAFTPGEQRRARALLALSAPSSATAAR